MVVTSSTTVHGAEPGPDVPAGPVPPWARAAVAAATALCAVLVVYRLGDRGLWFDEGSTIGTVDRPLRDALWRIVNWELNQSTYHLLVLVWHRLVDGDAALRALSAVFAVASVPLCFLVGRRLVGVRVAVVATGLLAIHPFVIEWGQQLRGYSLVLLLTLAATLLLIRAVEEPTGPRIAAYAVVGVLAVYTQFFAVLVLATHAASLGLLRPLPRRLVIGAGAIGGVLLLPVAEFLVNRQGDPLEWVEEPSTTQLNATAGELAGGGRLQLVVYGLVVAVGVVVLVRRALDRTDPAAAWRAALPVLLLVVPPLATVLISVTAKPLVEARFLIVAVPGLVLVAAAAIEAVPRLLGAAALGALLVVSVLGLRDWYDRPPFDQWREAVAAISETAAAGDLILTDPLRGVHVVRHYVKAYDLPVAVGYPADMGALDPDQVYVLIRYDESVPTDWYLRPEMDVWLADHYELVGEQVFAGVLVRHLEQRR